MPSCILSSPSFARSSLSFSVFAASSADALGASVRVAPPEERSPSAVSFAGASRSSDAASGSCDGPARLPPEGCMSPHRPRRTTADAWASAVARSTGISWSSSRISRSQEASEDVLAPRSSESSESRRAGEPMPVAESVPQDEVVAEAVSREAVPPRSSESSESRRAGADTHRSCRCQPGAPNGSEARLGGSDVITVVGVEKSLCGSSGEQGTAKAQGTSDTHRSCRCQPGAPNGSEARLGGSDVITVVGVEKSLCGSSGEQGTAKAQGTSDTHRSCRCQPGAPNGSGARLGSDVITVVGVEKSLCGSSGEQGAAKAQGTSVRMTRKLIWSLAALGSGTRP